MKNHNNFPINSHGNLQRNYEICLSMCRSCKGMEFITRDRRSAHNYSRVEELCNWQPTYASNQSVALLLSCFSFILYVSSFPSLSEYQHFLLSFWWFCWLALAIEIHIHFCSALLLWFTTYFINLTVYQLSHPETNVWIFSPFFHALRLPLKPVRTRSTKRKEILWTLSKKQIKMSNDTTITITQKHSKNVAYH